MMRNVKIQLRGVGTCAAAVVLAVTLVACQSTPTRGVSYKDGVATSSDYGYGDRSANSAKSGSNQLDPRLRESSAAEFFSKSGWQACAGGVVAGALGCAVSNSSNKDSCAVVAAVAGCGIGMGVNYYLDARRSQYANKEQFLDAVTADVRRDNAELRHLTADAQRVLADDKRKLAQIKKDMESKKIGQQQARQQLASIDKNAQYLRDTLAKTRKREQDWRRVAQEERRRGANTRKLDAEIDRMKAQVSVLESEVDDLYAQRAAIRMG